MITIYNTKKSNIDRVNGEVFYLLELRGLSTDEKPITIANGTIENGMLKVTTRSAHTLKEPITITNRNSFSLEMTVNTYASGAGGTGDIILQTAPGAKNAGFLNVPSGNNDATGNGFTLRDPNRTASLLFKKDTND